MPGRQRAGRAAHAGIQQAVHPPGDGRAPDEQQFIRQYKKGSCRNPQFHIRLLGLLYGRCDRKRFWRTWLLLGIALFGRDETVERLMRSGER